MSKPVYLGLSILESSKILMHDVWNDHLKPKYDEKVKLFYTVRVVSLYKLKEMMFIKILQKMLRLDLIFQIMNQIDHCLK